MTNETANDTAVALDLSTFGDPKALFAQLGGTGPVHRVLLPDGMPGWLVTGNTEVREALSDPRLVRSVTAAASELRPYLGLASADFVLTQHMLFADPPDHTRLRKLVSQAFTPRRVDLLRPRVQQITDELIDTFAADGEVDLVEAFALPLPIAVICDLLGVPFGDRAEFEQYAEVITGINASSSHEEVIGAGRWFDTYIAGLVEERRRNPGTDMISGMITAQENDDRLTDVEVRSNSFLLLAAGFETTVNLVANGVLALLQHPESMRRLREEPGLVPEAVEEILRYDSPVSSITYRFAAESMEIGGVRISAGEHVALSPPAANHDPVRFPRPDVFDIGRRTNGHMSFGHSIHFCLGAPLARLEGEIAFASLLRRLDGLELTVPSAELTWKPTFIVHRLDRLPVRFVPERRALSRAS
jgi:cytochrome P450